MLRRTLMIFDRQGLLALPTVFFLAIVFNFSNPSLSGTFIWLTFVLMGLGVLGWSFILQIPEAILHPHYEWRQWYYYTFIGSLYLALALTIILLINWPFHQVLDYNLVLLVVWIIALAQFGWLIHVKTKH